MIEEENLIDILPITILLGYISYKFLDNYFYLKYFYLNKDFKGFNNFYYSINGKLCKINKNKLIQLKPLECSKNLLNFNRIYNDSSDSDTEDNTEDNTDNDVNNMSNSLLSDIKNEEFLNITNEETKTENTSDKEVENNIDIENYKNYSVFIMTNYSTEIKKTNNPFYKNLNIVVDVLFDKNTENEDLDKYLEQIKDWKLEDINHEYYKLEIISNNVEYIFDNLLLLLNKYYSIHSNINVIFNHNELNNFRKDVFSNISSYKIINNKPTYKYLNFNFISMYDLYGYINNKKNELNYDNINFEKFQDLIDYYNLESVNLENTEDKDSGVFESILNKFY